MVESWCEDVDRDLELVAAMQVDWMSLSKDDGQEADWRRGERNGQLTTRA
ncbi:MAG: hypothetical protein ACRED2_08050 [Methylocella sp.]